MGKVGLFWQMHNVPDILKGADAFNIVDDSKIECLDRETLIEYHTRGFASGCPLNLRGEWALTHLPPDFHRSLFQTHGIIATKPVADAFQRLAPNDIQRFPIVAAGDPNRFEMINLIRNINCLDLEKSDIHFFPKKPNKPMALLRIVLQRKPIGNCQIFRLSNHKTTVVVSEELRARLTAEVDINGTMFREAEAV